MSNPGESAGAVTDPRQMPELRGKVLSWLTTKGAFFYSEMGLTGKQRVLPPSGPSSPYEQLAAEEHERVSGELYWVSPDMAALAQHAGGQLGTPELHEHNLPASRGFIMFANPIASYGPGKAPVHIVAASWGVLHGPIIRQLGPLAAIPVGAGWVEGACWITFYSDVVRLCRSLEVADPQYAASFRAFAPPVLPDNELVWPFGPVEDAPATFAGQQTTAAWGQTLCAAWLLMAQPLAARTAERAPRPARRRLQRADLPVADVQIIHVRRPQRRPGAVTSPAAKSQRQYGCRWWVTGHWRTYHAGPGRSKAIRRYIVPYVAGPDGKPLRGTERVRVWDR